MRCASGLPVARMRLRPASKVDGARPNFPAFQVPALLRLNAAFAFALILAISRPGLAGNPFFGPRTGLPLVVVVTTARLLARVPAFAADGRTAHATRPVARSHFIPSIIMKAPEVVPLQAASSISREMLPSATNGSSRVYRIEIFLIKSIFTMIFDSKMTLRIRRLLSFLKQSRAEAAANDLVSLINKFMFEGYDPCVRARFACPKLNDFAGCAHGIANEYRGRHDQLVVAQIGHQSAQRGITHRQANH